MALQRPLEGRFDLFPWCLARADEPGDACGQDHADETMHVSSPGTCRHEWIAASSTASHGLPPAAVRLSAATLVAERRPPGSATLPQRRRPTGAAACAPPAARSPP